MLKRRDLEEGQWNPGAGGAGIYHEQNDDGFTRCFGGLSPSSRKEGDEKSSKTKQGPSRALLGLCSGFWAIQVR